MYLLFIRKLSNRVYAKINTFVFIGTVGSFV